MSTYETIVVFKTKLSGEEIDKATSKIEEIITSGNGRVISIDKWGIKKLQSDVKKQKEGFYVYIKFDGPGDLVSTLAKSYRVTDTIVKFLTTRVEQKKEPKPDKVQVPKNTQETSSGN